MKSMKIQIIAALLLCIALFSITAKASVDSVANMTCNSRTSTYNCMVCNCYHESRGESLDGMIAVSKVVLSRAASGQYPKSLCKVIYQDAQFSWTQDRNDNNIHPNKDNSRESVIAGIAACKRATSIAMSEGENGVLFYFNPAKARPRWARSMTSCGKLGQHLFMVQKGETCPRHLGLSLIHI